MVATADDAEYAWASNEGSRPRVAHDAIACGILVLDGSGTVIEANEAAGHVFGCKVESLLDRQPWPAQTISDESGNDVSGGPHPAMRALRDGAAVHGATISVLRPDGEVRWLKVDAVPLGPADAVRWVVVSLTDVTSSKLLAEELRQSERRFSSMVGNTSDILAILDVAGTLTYVSPAAKSVLGCRPGDRIGTPLRAWIHPDDADRLETTLLAPANDPESAGTVEFRIRREDGAWRWMEAVISRLAHDPAISGTLLSMRDVSERRKAQEELAQSEERYRRLVEHSPEAIGVHMNGVVVYTNAAAARLLGAQRVEDLLGMKVFDLVHPDYRALAIERVRRTIEQGELQEPVEEVFLRLDGQVIDVEVTAMPITFNGQPATQVVVRDITHRKQAETALRDSEERYRELFENAIDAVYTHDLDGRFTSLNRATEQILGYSAAELLGQDIFEVIAPEHRGLSRTMLQAKLDGALHTTYEIDFITRDGRRVPLEVSTRLMYENGVPVGVQATSRDITDRRRAAEALAHQALHDALTDMPNRALLFDRLRQAVLTARREREQVALLIMDLDRFKEVNDSFGHHYGDLLLKQVGPRLHHALRESDTVARMGGDEFALLLPSCDVGGATLAAEKVLAALAPAFVLDSHSFDVGASIGIALCPEHGEDAETLLRRADVAMYVAKRAGSGYSIYEPELDQHSRTRLSLIGELRNAIDNGDLVLYFQPKAYVATACVDHLEALVRWRHPDRGLIPPDDFVPLAEQTGLIKPLTMWVLEAAFHQCREWHSAGRDFSVAVNLSMRNLLDPHLADYISGLIQRYEVPAQALELELTESIVMADPERTLGILQRLHDMGIRLTIDDFGTGYSSLAYLKRLPVDEIKIDRSFVTEMASDDNDAAIVRSIINLAHDLGLEVTGEGVEDSTTWKLLVALGCDAIQGAYLGLAMPAEDVEGWIRRAPHQFGLGAASSFP